MTPLAAATRSSAGTTQSDVGAVLGFPSRLVLNVLSVLAPGFSLVWPPLSRSLPAACSVASLTLPASLDVVIWASRYPSKPSSQDIREPSSSTNAACQVGCVHGAPARHQRLLRSLALLWHDGRMSEGGLICFNSVLGATPMHLLKLVLRASLNSLVAAVLFLLCSSSHVPVAAYQQGTPGNITGSYMLDNRPEELWFLSLTQVGESVSGYALVIEPEVVGDLAQQQLGVSGSTDGAYVTLTIGDGWSGSIIMSGTLEGDDLILSFPTDIGGVGTAVFTSASPEELNQVLANWQYQGGAEDRLWSIMLTDLDMPTGIQVLADSPLAENQVALAYPGVAEDQLSTWGWVASVNRSYGTSGSSSPSDKLETMVITLHQFATAGGTSSALSAFATSDEANGWEPGSLNTSEVKVLTRPTSGNGLIPDGVDVKVYLQLGDIVADIRGFAFDGDPTADTTEVARRLYDPIYRSTVQQLEDHIASADSTSGQLQGMEETVQFEVDEVGRVVEDLQRMLDDLKLQREGSLDCFALETLRFSYEDTMGFAYTDSLVWAQGQYRDAVQDLESVMVAIDSTTAAATATLDELATIRSSMPAPLTQAPDTLFSDERAAIDTIALRKGQAQETLAGLEGQYDEEIASAEAIMAEGRTIVDEVQASLSC